MKALSHIVEYVVIKDLQSNETWKSISNLKVLLLLYYLGRNVKVAKMLVS